MPLKKLNDLSRPCISREHNPPAHILLKPGRYEWECPACHHKQIFVVPMIMCRVWKLDAAGPPIGMERSVGLDLQEREDTGYSDVEDGSLVYELREAGLDVRVSRRFWPSSVQASSDVAMDHRAAREGYNPNTTRE